jgi:hypothetical protein
MHPSKDFEDEMSMRQWRQWDIHIRGQTAKCKLLYTDIQYFSWGEITVSFLTMLMQCRHHVHTCNHRCLRGSGPRPLLVDRPFVVVNLSSWLLLVSSPHEQQYRVPTWRASVARFHVAGPACQWSSCRVAVCGRRRVTPAAHVSSSCHFWQTVRASVVLGSWCPWRWLAQLLWCGLEWPDYSLKSSLFDCTTL